MLSGSRTENRPADEASARSARRSLSKWPIRPPKRCGAVPDDENRPATILSMLRSISRPSGTTTMSAGLKPAASSGGGG